MMLNTDTTIAAIATARGQASVAVLRISGRDAWDIARAMFSRKKIKFEPGRFYHGWITDNGNIVDEVLLLVFKGPNSYTGEDVVEIHCHGGDVISHKILRLCVKLGARLAMPGEYTMRAYLNGKMDLTQAESVMDLISSRSERLLSQASNNLKNRSLGKYIDEMSQDLLDLQAQVVASIDFPEEVEEPDRQVIAAKLETCLQGISRLREGAQRNRMVREGLKVAILGMPNSGKSSLFNALLARDRSIVTEHAGTTRDVITETFDIDGIPITLIDTAGIRETRHSIEMMGIERSWQAASEAQIVLYLIDASVGLLRYDTQILAKLDPQTTIVVGNKKDLLTAGHKIYSNWVYVSVKTRDGMNDIYAALQQKIRAFSHEDDGFTLSLNERQIRCCEEVEERLRNAYEAIHSTLPLDVVTLPMTEALRKLDELMGRDTTEEVLSNIFERFCVGK
jgi:tRNA modification GTPase